METRRAYGHRRVGLGTQYDRNTRKAGVDLEWLVVGEMRARAWSKGAVRGDTRRGSEGKITQQPSSAKDQANKSPKVDKTTR
jgi:hypothetical protein